MCSINYHKNLELTLPYFYCHTCKLMRLVHQNWLLPEHSTKFTISVDIPNILSITKYFALYTAIDLLHSLSNLKFKLLGNCEKHNSETIVVSNNILNFMSIKADNLLKNKPLKFAVNNSIIHMILHFKHDIC